MTKARESLRCRGMRDLLPGDMERFRYVESAFRRVCLAWGYQEVRTPTIEHLHLFTAAGTLSPQMLGRVYSFLDWDGWSGDRVVLRPDATIPTARLFVEHLAGRRAAKLFYVQNVFRFADGDETREYWQCGAELIGETGRQGDLELILLALSLLESLGLTGVEVLQSHAGIPRALLAHSGLAAAEQVRLYDRILDGDSAVLAEVAERLPHLAQSLQLLFGLEGGRGTYVGNLRASLASVLPELAEPLTALALMCDTLDGLGCPYRVVPALVRNFEYYTGPIFHFLAGDRKLGGGGRYDGLTSLIGGEAAPSSGFALDIDAVLSHLPRPQERTAWPRGVLLRLATDDASVLTAAFTAVRRLHTAGIAAEVVSDDSDATRYRWELTVGGAPDQGCQVMDRLDGSRRQTATLDEALNIIGGSR